MAEHINHSDRTVRVHPAPGGKRPSWGGYIPHMLSFELCQQIRMILCDKCEYPYIDDPLAKQLKDKREELGETLRRSAMAVQSVRGKTHIWTFAGGRVNHTLRRIFTVVGGFKATSDNFQVRLERDSATHRTFSEVMDRMGENGFWSDKSVWSPIAADLPEYRLSKFQRALPAEFSQEMVVDYLLDLNGTRSFVKP